MTPDREKLALEALRWAYDTLYEINPDNYDHDEVCKLNSASVEVILGLAPLLGEDRAAKEAELSAVSKAIGSARFMDPPDGGDVSLAEQVGRMREALAAAEARLAVMGEALKAAHRRCRNDMGYDMEHGPVGCTMGDGCACVGEYATLLYGRAALTDGERDGD